MATATTKKKYHYYVLVFSEFGPVYVTKVNNSDRTAEWCVKEPPLEFSESYANDLAIGLMMNFHHAVMVKTPYEVKQPYRYDKYEIEWKEKTEEK